MSNLYACIKPIQYKYEVCAYRYKRVSYCVRIGYGMGQIQMDIKGVAHHVRIGYDMGEIQMDIVFLLFKRFWFLCPILIKQGPDLCPLLHTPL